VASGAGQRGGNPAVRSYGSRVPRSRGARGSTRWTRWASLPG